MHRQFCGPPTTDGRGSLGVTASRRLSLSCFIRMARRTQAAPPRRASGNAGPIPGSEASARQPRVGPRPGRPLPGEAVAFRLAAEVAVSRGRLVDRLVEAEVRADAARRQAAELARSCRWPAPSPRRPPCRCRAYRHRATGARDADRVGELDGAAAWRAPPRRCSSRGSARHRRPSGRPWSGPCLRKRRRRAGRAAVGVDDDLAAGNAGVAVRSADLEAAGRVDVIDGLVASSSAGARRRRRPSHKRGARPLLALVVAGLCWVETTIAVALAGLPPSKRA